MVNVTISVPEALKSKMDEHQDVNWSRVCREAMEAHISMLENPIPKIRVELREVRFGYTLGKPGLLLDLVFKNEMNTQLTLDRMLFEVNFIPSPETTLSVGSGVEMNKRDIPMGRWVMIPFMKVDPNVILRLDEQLPRTFQCAAHITAFFEGFKVPYTMSLSIKVPIDEWKRFVELVVKSEKKIMKIREKRLSEIVVKL